MGIHAKRTHTALPTIQPPDGIHARPAATAALDANKDRPPCGLLPVITSVHSERLEPLRAVQRCFSDTRVRDMACVLVEADGYPALAVSRLDGIGGTLTLGCGYVSAQGRWWIMTRHADGRTVGLAPAREPLKVTQVVIAEMRRRTAA
ncbi:hypothetical protein [Actinomadura macra]|uniref:hypothetical protein n=1 Tax=Actinomadura macra TaxID=46164 RepID=UPI000A95A600|nr:hypothetical protein [Actinomadura macra]